MTDTPYTVPTTDLGTTADDPISKSVTVIVANKVWTAGPAIGLDFPKDSSGNPIFTAGATVPTGRMTAPQDQTQSSPSSATVVAMPGAQVGCAVASTYDIRCDTSNPLTVSFVDSRGAAIGRLGPVRFAPILGFTVAAGGTSSFGLMEHIHGVFTPAGPLTVVATDAGAPVRTAIQMTSSIDPGWDYSYIHPITEPATSNIPSNAVGMTLWVCSDGTPSPLSVRLRDATGQIFQPRADADTWTGWRALTIPFSGQIWHYGGANDGVMHFPLQWEALVLLDRGRGATKNRTILIGDPNYILQQTGTP